MNWNKYPETKPDKEGKFLIVGRLRNPHHGTEWRAIFIGEYHPDYTITSFSGHESNWSVDDTFFEDAEYFMTIPEMPTDVK